MFEEGTPIDRALERAAEEALKFQQRIGETVPVWVDGRTVWMNPNEIKPKRRRRSKGSGSS